MAEKQQVLFSWSCTSSLGFCDHQIGTKSINCGQIAKMAFLRKSQRKVRRTKLAQFFSIYTCFCGQRWNGQRFDTIGQSIFPPYISNISTGMAKNDELGVKGGSMDFPAPRFKWSTLQWNVIDCMILRWLRARERIALLLIKVFLHLGAGRSLPRESGVI